MTKSYDIECTEQGFDIDEASSAINTYQSALKAVQARVDGVCDHPDLVAWGPLSTSSDDDIRRIISATFNKIPKLV